MTFFISPPTVLVQQTLRIHEQVQLIESQIKCGEVAELRPANVLSMRSVHTSLRDKAHERTSDFDRKFVW